MPISLKNSLTKSPVMPSQYSEQNKLRARQTLESIHETLVQLIEWNKDVNSADDYYASQSGMQLLAANCTLITAIGEGINRINRILPDYLLSEFPEVPWKAIIGMRNHIAHGYFELDAELVFEAIRTDIPALHTIVREAVRRCS